MDKAETPSNITLQLAYLEWSFFFFLSRYHHWWSLRVYMVVVIGLSMLVSPVLFVVSSFPLLPIKSNRPIIQSRPVKAHKQIRIDRVKNRPSSSVLRCWYLLSIWSNIIDVFQMLRNFSKHRQGFYIILLLLKFFNLKSWLNNHEYSRHCKAVRSWGKDFISQKNGKRKTGMKINLDKKGRKERAKPR